MTHIREIVKISNNSLFEIRIVLIVTHVTFQHLSFCFFFRYTQFIFMIYLFQDEIKPHTKKRKKLVEDDSDWSLDV